MRILVKIQLTTLPLLHRTKMTEQDKTNSFLEEMKDVAPLSQDKVVHSRTSSTSDDSINYRRKAASKKVSVYENFLTDGDVEPVEPQEVLSFKISGIQPNVFKNLKQAKYKFDYHLDLHRMSVSQAREAVYKLISSAEVEDLRCFLITHGKGERSKHPARLKSYVNHWMKQIDQVVAFHSAQPHHGGTGSIYVLLKKTKQKRKINQSKYD